jgi:AGCS family alanine or glycine:cation symporter
MKNALNIGFRRGVFTNEAGLGSTVFIHAASDVREPSVLGMWGIFEVFLDTIVMCLLTALAVFSSGAVGTRDAGGALIDGAPLVTLAMAKTFGNAAGGIVSISTALFAFAAIIGWSYYGLKALEYLMGRNAVLPYKLLYIACTFIGSVMDLRLAWSLADTLNGLMVLPNLIGVLALSGTVLKITKEYLNYERR